MFILLVFFFKQKTAYDMRISDWSSDVCSSDLSSPLPPLREREGPVAQRREGEGQGTARSKPPRPALRPDPHPGPLPQGRERESAARKSVVSGKSVSVRVDLCGRSIITKTN